MRCPVLASIAMIALAGCFRAVPVPAPTSPVAVNVPAAPPTLTVYSEPWCKAALAAGLAAELAGEPWPALVSAGLLDASSHRAAHRLTASQARSLLGTSLVGLGAADQPLLLVGRLGLLDTMYLHHRIPSIRRQTHILYYPAARAQAMNTSFWSRPTTTRVNTNATRPTAAKKPATKPTRPTTIRTRR